MTPVEIIRTWQTGCSCADNERPEQCHECTDAMIAALKREMPGACQSDVYKLLFSLQSELRYRIPDDVVSSISVQFMPLKS